MTTITEFTAPLPDDDLPGRRAGLVSAILLAPAYLFIALSIMGGVPAADAWGAWAFVAALSALAPAAHGIEVGAWKLRRALGAPPWWTVSRHKTADKAIWMAAIVAYCLIPQSLIGWAAAQHWAICWLGLMPLVFLIGEALDSAIGTFGRAEDADR